MSTVESRLNDAEHLLETMRRAVQFYKKLPHHDASTPRPPLPVQPHQVHELLVLLNGLWNELQADFRQPECFEEPRFLAHYLRELSQAENPSDERYHVAFEDWLSEVASEWLVLRAEAKSRSTPTPSNASPSPPPLSPPKLEDTDRKRFAVALSFPGEHRDYIERVALALEKHLPRERIFYDKNYEPELARFDLDVYLQDIYQHQTELIVAFLSGRYESKNWCGWEWRIIRERLLQRRANEVLLLRLDNAPIEGLLANDGFIDIRKRSPTKVAKLILERLRQTGTHAPEAPLPDSLTQDFNAAVEHWKSLLRKAAPREKISQARQEIAKLQRLRRAGRPPSPDEFLSGRYQLQEMLGRGGFATVWKAYDAEYDRHVAVKILHPHYVMDSCRRDRFFKGAREVVRLKHPHIVQILEAECQDDPYHYFVMQFSPGGDLEAAVLAGRVPPEMILRYVCQVGTALDYAHERGIFHRDVKPSNILLEGETALLADFDLIKVEDSSWGTGKEPMGTFGYAAPEVLDDASKADARSDVFSLGMVTLFGLRRSELPSRVLRDADWIIDELDISHEVKHVLKQAVRWAPEERFETVGAFCNSLRQAWQPDTSSATSSSGLASLAVRPRPNSTPIIGIDFGTTNSLVAVFQRGKPAIIPNRLGSRFTPSVVLFSRTGEIAVGEPARAQAQQYPDRAVFSVKRMLGTDWGIDIDGRRYSATEVTACILRALREDAERALGTAVSEAVLTVPAYSGVRQQEALLAAAHEAGLSVRRMVPEPTAAAMVHYEFLSNDHTYDLVAVCDLGGGTFDVSIVQIGGEIVETISVNGHTALGGDDFDQRIVQFLRQGFEAQHALSLPMDAATQFRLKTAAENAKISLSGLERVTLNIPYLAWDPRGPKHLEQELTRVQFDELTKDLVKQIIDCCQSAMQDTRAVRIRELVLVGMTTRIPAVRQALTSIFGRAPRSLVDAEEAVALGAAIQGAILAGSKRNLLLLDIVPKCLGIMCRDGMKLNENIGEPDAPPGLFVPIINRHDTLPALRRVTFTTVEDGQTSITFDVLQEEPELPGKMTHLGQLRLTNIPPVPKGELRIKVVFDLDASANLRVTASEGILGKGDLVRIQSRGSIPNLGR